MEEASLNLYTEETKRSGEQISHRTMAKSLTRGATELTLGAAAISNIYH